MIKTTASAVLLCALLSACGSDGGARGPGSETNDEPGNRVDSNAGEHFLSDQQRALENAQSAADALEKATQAQQQALEEAQQ